MKGPELKNKADPMELIEPWFAVTAKEKEAFEKEFSKELHGSHFLYEKKLNLIGRREDRDDILFIISGTTKLAVVHLTWSGRRETGGWPKTQILSIQEFLRAMKIENRELGYLSV